MVTLRSTTPPSARGPLGHRTPGRYLLRGAPLGLFAVTRYVRPPLDSGGRDAARASGHRLSRCPRHCPCTNCATLPTESAGGAMGFIFRSQLGTTPAPPLRAHPPSGVEDLDAQALVALALALGLQHAHRASLDRMRVV